MDRYLEQNRELFARRRHGLLWDVVFLALGILMAVVALKLKMADSVVMLLLSTGAIMILTCIVLLVVHSDTHSGNLVYRPTGSKMKTHRCYLAADSRRESEEALRGKDVTALVHLHRENSTSTMLRIEISDDDSCALVQLCEYIPHSFVPMTEVVMFNGADAVKLRAWLRQG